MLVQVQQNEIFKIPIIVKSLVNRRLFIKLGLTSLAWQQTIKNTQFQVKFITGIIWLLLYIHHLFDEITFITTSQPNMQKLNMV